MPTMEMEAAAEAVPAAQSRAARMASTGIAMAVKQGERWKGMDWKGFRGLYSRTSSAYESHKLLRDCKAG